MSGMSFDHTMIVRLFDTDAAGCIFYGNQFRMAHEAFEAFMEHHGLPVGRVIRESRFLCPIVHAEADYLAPLMIGDRVTVRVAVEKVGRTSFAVGYRFFRDGDASPSGRVGTVQVVIDRETGRPVPVPDELRRLLESARVKDPSA